MIFIDGFKDIDLLYPKNASSITPRAFEVRQKLVNIVSIWAEELHSVYIANELVKGGLSKHILIGWMLEMYHYISDFPKALQ